ncbi:MAG: Na/Pi cotransporter family protein [Treponema sp.]|nr:Na/Pi cotransporter family protein [Treponema sp.]
MNAIETVLQLAGSLGFVLYGMKLMSNGVQKSAGETLQRTLSKLTGNRFISLLTGLLITMIIQSSGATTVMVVSFVNAEMISLTQAIGVIYGANIGTTITAWIVSLFGFNFNITSFAIPLFGFGFLLTALSRLRKQNLGEAIMGFGLLFVGLSMLSQAITLDPATLTIIASMQGHGAGSILLGVATGIVITALLHSSSAMTAIILTMAYGGLVTWEFSAAMVIGSNVGSTIDSILASFGARVNARRSCLVHVLFNVTGAVLALIFFHPLLTLCTRIIPGPVEANIVYNIAMLHTLFNLLTALIFLPFVKQLAMLTEWLIKPNADEERLIYRLEFTELGFKENAAAAIIRAEKEINDFTDVATAMFDRIQMGFQDRSRTFIENHLQALEQSEQYADQMHEQLIRYLLHCEQLPVNDRQLNNLSTMIQIVDDLENMTDDCFSVGMLLARSIEKHMTFPQEDMDRLIPYVELARQFLQFVRININKHLNKDKLDMAHELEDHIDLFRNDLKKVARKRLESGADVKAELLYIDMVRQIEKIGDRAFSISRLLSQTL